jgi:hypothetical protein
VKKQSIKDVADRMAECVDQQRQSREAIMCSKSAAQTVTRVATGIMTFGSSEAVRNIPGVGSIAKLPENVAGTVANVVSPPKPPAPPSPTDAAGDTSQPPPDQGPLPTAQAADPTTLAAQARRRRLASLRQGIAQTVATSGQGVAGAPTLLTPTAVAGKTKLGQ